MILAPASASTINSMHHGLGNNLVLSLFLAHDWDKPYYIAPAMNTKMWTHPATTLSLTKLKNWGVKILEPEEGSLACGDYGAGRMVSSDSLVQAIEKYKENQIRLSVLITAGGTKEPIDGARFISNISTGKTAAKVAEVFINNGWDVTYLSSKDSEVPNGKFKKKNFSTFNDLDKEIKSLIRNRKFDVFIHSAAVSDYSPLKVNEHIKINSTKKTLTLTFKKTPKLVNKLLYDSYNKSMKLIAFKFTVNLDINQKIEKIEKLLKESNADIVIQNDISDRKEDRQTGFNLYNKKGKISEATDAHSLGSILQKEMREAIL
jgi:phosphopantothenoylcysteine decarboxylase/phosphopantothenate--cysteine ligase